jgi:hypothetical protein
MGEEKISVEPEPIANDKRALSASFALIQAAQACESTYRRLAESTYKNLAQSLDVAKYGADRPIPITIILEADTLEAAIWALGAVQPDQKNLGAKLARLFACDCAQRTIHLCEKAYPRDKRPWRAIDSARRFARGEISAEELGYARDAARDAAKAAEDAIASAMSRAWGSGSRAAVEASWQAMSVDPCVNAIESAVAATIAYARDAALAASQSAARAAACAADKDGDWSEAISAEKEFQRELLIYYLLNKDSWA